MMSDGPSCMPLDKYYNHSRLLYKGPNIPESLDPTKFGQTWTRAKTYGSDVMKQLMNLSDDKGRFEVGIQVLQSQYTFILKFFMYDEVSKDQDYPIARSFGKIYSPTVELVVSFPNQVMLSQKRPPHEVRIDHVSDMDDNLFYMPSDTYAYTT